MYKFSARGPRGQRPEEWTLCESATSEYIRLDTPERSFGLSMNKNLVKELVIRLQFFLDNGRLPAERPEEKQTGISPECYRFYCHSCERQFYEGESKTVDGPECPRCNRVNSVTELNRAALLLNDQQNQT